MKSIINAIKELFAYFRGNRNIQFSFLIMFILISISTLFLSINISGDTFNYKLGEIARENIASLRDTSYINELETEKKRDRIASTVPLVFNKDESVLLEKLKNVNLFFTDVQKTLNENPPLGTDDLTFQLIALKSKLPKYLQFKDSILLNILRYKNVEKLKKTVYKILVYLYDNDKIGIIDKKFINPLPIKTKNISIRFINSTNTGDEITRTLDSLKSLDVIRKRLNGLVYSIAPNLAKTTRYSLVYIIRHNLQANLHFDLDETNRRINEGRSSVSPKKFFLKKGQSIVRKGDPITSEVLAKIKILNKSSKNINIKFTIGIFLLQFLFLAIFGFFLLEFKQVLIPDIKSSIVLFTVLIFFMIFSFFISKSDFLQNGAIIPILILPIPFVTMIIAILYNVYLSMIVGIFITFFSIVLLGGDFSIVILAFSSSFLGVIVNSNVKKRSDFLIGGIILGLLTSIVILSLYLMKEIRTDLILKNIVIALTSGVINSILVFGLLPLYENLFSVTTKFKLLELSDLNAEIFKEMLVNAPGTYNHSLLVSTMAENACKTINADYLLARVGAFYHDIGKIEDAGIYIENKVTDPRAKNLSSLDYSKLIISHIPKGVKMAREHNLPESIINFIREHHGKTVMNFFYHKALEEATSNDKIGEIKKEDFQYEGPEPHSKETAVVMLADAIEAASRSLQTPTYENLEDLVTRIIYNKLNEGALEKSELSMADIDKIKSSFLVILSGIFHTRIEYPDSQEMLELEEKVEQVKDNGKSS